MNPDLARGSRLAGVLLALGLVAAACGSGSSTSATGGSSGSAAADPTEDEAPASHACSSSPVASSERSVTWSGLEWVFFGTPLASGIAEPLLELERVVPVVRPDGIPAIDNPQCLTADAVTSLEDDAAVVVLEVDGDARAYPLEILTRHELVNDTVGGIPITISYCPLCNSAIAYDRRVGERVLDFGTSGALTQSSMIMYDRQTESLWTHFNGKSFAGELTGTELVFFSTAVVSWATFRDEFPEGLVLSRDTGFDRDYGRNPYQGYETGDGPYTQFITDEIDPRLDAQERVIGIERAGEVIAVVHQTVMEAGVVDVTVANERLTVWNLPGTSSALDGESVSGGLDVGASGVFRPVAGQQELTFARTETGFVDNETGSSWSILGRATSGPLAGEQLEPVPHLDTFWFAWGTFHAATEISG